jgi:hypothetical protein
MLQYLKENGRTSKSQYREEPASVDLLAFRKRAFGMPALLYCLFWLILRISELRKFGHFPVVPSRLYWKKSGVANNADEASGEQGENGMSQWKPMRPISTTGPGGTSTALPGQRGRYLLLLEEPFVNGEPHWAHFNWVGQAFCIRDFINSMEMRQGTYQASDVWQAAKGRIPCTTNSPHGDLHVPVTNFEFWQKKLQEISDAEDL